MMISKYASYTWDRRGRVVGTSKKAIFEMHIIEVKHAYPDIPNKAGKGEILYDYQVRPIEHFAQEVILSLVTI